ncbi:hypothetical protein [Methylobacterium sp. WL8]|uniref:hypothetical protein n=1 Tax=Methylobacterium sp. WL8 TaxID=2603899 RepID=UPI0011C87B43|nr:hypothetical protein [Methylobacterium sp. WL8]TXN78748.1 hypothetical protein FV234_22280 [Methylobacterium sp. WL8]
MGAENFAEQERLMQRLDRKCQEQTERVRDMVREAGRPDLLAEFDQRLRESDLGITGARSTWHSISDAQRRLLILLSNGPASVRRTKGASYDVVSEAGSRATGIRLGTVRNLARRELLEWTGGAFDPEASAAPTERMAFVLKHGRPAPGAHFDGFRP